MLQTVQLNFIYALYLNPYVIVVVCLDIFLIVVTNYICSENNIFNGLRR